MKFLGFLLQNLPHILQGVIAVEGAVQAPGATKKAIVLNAVTAAAQAGEQITDAHVQAISNLIDSTVSTLNASGIFKKAAPAQ